MSEPNAAVPSVVTLTERIAAPPEVVFEFFVDPDKMLRWMGTAIDIEPEPGGKFWLNATGSDIAIGSFVTVEHPRLIVFTWGWQGSVEVPPGSSTVTVTFTPDGDQTIVELCHEGLPGGASDRHAEGWTSFLGRLSVAATGGDPDRT